MRDPATGTAALRPPRWRAPGRVLGPLRCLLRGLMFGLLFDPLRGPWRLPLRGLLRGPRGPVSPRGPRGPLGALRRCAPFAPLSPRAPLVPLTPLAPLAPLAQFMPIMPLVLLIAVLGLPPTLARWPAGDAAAVGGGAAGDGGGTLADAVSALVVLYAVLRVVRQRRRPLARTAAVVLGLPVIGLAVAAAGAADSATGLAGLARYAQVFVLVPAAVLLVIRDRTDFRLVAWSLVALAGWQGGLGVHQYVTRTGASYMGSDVRAVGTFGPTDVMGMATVVAYGVVCAVGLALAPPPPAAAAPSPAPHAATPSPTTPAAVTPSPSPPTPTAAAPSPTASATVAPPATAAPPAAVTPPPGRGRRRERIAALGCALLLLVPLALSFSRGAWIATAVACGAQLALVGRRPSPRTCIALVTAAAALVGGLVLGPALLKDAVPHRSMLGQRLDSIAHVTDRPDQSVVDRYALWATALDIWRERPLTGVGLKGFAAHRDTHAPLALSAGSDTDGAGAAFRRQPLLSPHNMYLLVLAEQGLIGLTSLTIAWAALLVLGVRRGLGVGGARAARPRHGWLSGRPAHPEPEPESSGARRGAVERAGSRRAPGAAGQGSRPTRAPQRRLSGWARCAVRARFSRERCGGRGVRGSQRACVRPGVQAPGAAESHGAPPHAERAPYPGPALRRPPAARPPHGAECALVACGLLVWQLVDFVYADIGGPSTVLTAVVLGVAAWWSLAPAAWPGGTSGDGTVGDETTGNGTADGGPPGGGTSGGGGVVDGGTSGGGEVVDEGTSGGGGAGSGASGGGRAGSGASGGGKARGRTAEGGGALGGTAGEAPAGDGAVAR